MSEVRVGNPYQITYRASSATATVTAMIKGPDTDEQWEDIVLLDIATPEGHDKLLVSEYTPVKPGWYIVSFLTSPDGGQSMAKFHAYWVNDVVVASGSTRSVVTGDADG